MRVIINKSQFIKPVLKDLLDSPVVIRVGKITEDSTREFCQSFNSAHQTGQSIIPIIIDSPGGSVYSLLSMLAEIENTDRTVATVCIGKAMSAGSVLLAHGSPGYRFIDKNATVMIHEVGSGAWGKLEDMKTTVGEANRLNNLIFEKMAKACGHKDPKYFIKMIADHKNQDWYLTASSAKKYNIVDHIAIPIYNLFVSIKEELSLPNRKLEV